MTSRASGVISAGVRVATVVVVGVVGVRKHGLSTVGPTSGGYGMSASEVNARNHAALMLATKLDVAANGVAPLMRATLVTSDVGGSFGCEIKLTHQCFTSVIQGSSQSVYGIS